MIPPADPGSRVAERREAIDDAIERVLDSGHYILGDEVDAFEDEFADDVGTERAVGVSSGTQALSLALEALGIGPGDEVVTVSHTAVATVAAITSTGARPVLVDVDPDDATMDPAAAEAAITDETEALLPVHLYGQPCRMQALSELAEDHELALVEDCSQAHGATVQGEAVGSIGDVGCFSFYPTKNLGAIGDGGAVTTDDRQLAARIESLREYGWDGDRVSQRDGTNARLDELQAAILREQLDHLDEDIERRRELAARYHDALENTDLTPPVPRDGTEHAYHLYVVQTDNRAALRDHLEEDGIGTGIHYPVPVHRQPAYDHLAPEVGLPHTEELADTVLSLPVYPTLTDKQVEQVAESVRRFHTEAGTR